MYSCQRQQILKEAIQAFPSRLKPKLPVRCSSDVSDAEPRRYLKVTVSDCDYAVAADRRRDRHRVIDVFAEHLRDVGLPTWLLSDVDRLVGEISLETGGSIAVALAHPCLDTWLGELQGDYPCPVAI